MVTVLFIFRSQGSRQIRIKAYKMELKPWNCPRCTFLNHEELIECECCNYNHKEHHYTQDITNFVESSIIDDSSCCICSLSSLSSLS